MRKFKNYPDKHRGIKSSFSQVVFFAALIACSSLFAHANSSESAPGRSLSLQPQLDGREPFYKISGADRTQVPFELIDSRPVFRVRLNESAKVFRFVLDTGSQMTVISTETASRLSLRGTASSRQAAGVGGAFAVVDGVLWSCEIGKVRLDNVPVFIRPFFNENNPVDGYIGLSFISQFVTSVDYGANILTLERPQKSDRVESFQGSTIPIKTTPGGIMINAARIDGIPGPLNFILDTGATVSVVAKSAETLAGVSSCKHGDRMRIIGAAGIEENVTTIFLPQLNVGTSQQPNILAVVLDLDLISRAVGSKSHGIVGGNFLRHYKVVFDLPRQVMRLWPLNEEAMVNTQASRTNP